MVVIDVCLVVGIVDLINQIGRIVEVIEAIIKCCEWLRRRKVQMGNDLRWVRAKFGPFMNILRLSLQQIVEILHQEVLVYLAIMMIQTAEWIAERTRAEKATIHRVRSLLISSSASHWLLIWSIFCRFTHFRPSIPF